MQPDRVRPGRRPLSKWLIVILVIGVTLYFSLALDQRHHWHEWRYLYSAANYPVMELGQGMFDPGPPPERSRDEVGAWYWGQMLHVSLLQGIIEALGTGEKMVRSAAWVYGLWVPLAVLLAFAALRRLGTGVDAGQIAVLAMLSPLGVYTGFKLMAEGPALLLASAGIWAFIVGTASQGARRVLLWVITAVFTALSFLAMDYMPLLVFGLVVAWSCCHSKDPWTWRWFGPAAVIAASVVFSLILAYVIYRVSPVDYISMHGFYRDYIKPLPVNLFGAATAWSALYLLVLFSVFSGHKRSLRFFGVWLLVSLLPLFVLSSNYIESRFLLVALFPLAALSVLGLGWLVRGINRRFAGLDRNFLSWCLVLFLVPLVSLATLPFMPYEMNAGELRRLVDRVQEIDTSAAVLVPWNYTDFHYLRVAFPQRPYYLVQSPVNEENEIVEESEWTRRRQNTYGNVFIADAAGLKQLEGKTLYYVGHGMLPPFQNLKRVASVLGLEAIAKRIDDMNPLNHIARSWLWHDPDFVFHPVARDGNYRLYRVERR